MILSGLFIGFLLFYAMNMNTNTAKTPDDNPADAQAAAGSTINSPGEATEAVSKELLLGLDINASITKRLEPTEESIQRAARASRQRAILCWRPPSRCSGVGAVTAAGIADQIAVFHKLLGREFISFPGQCKKANIKREHVVAASYALCSALDELANHTDWGGGKDGGAGVWSTQMLAAQFHNDTRSGERVFLLIGRLVGNPTERLDLLEVMFRILELEVEGQYSNRPNGRRDVIRFVRICMGCCQQRAGAAGVVAALEGGEAEGKLGFLRSVPVWVAASALTLAAFGLLSW